MSFHVPSLLLPLLTIAAASMLASAPSSAEPLTFDAALTLAERNSPDIEAQTAIVDAARSSARAAGALPDPRLELAVENLPVTGLDRWRLERDFMTMRKVGFMQEVPNAARRRASAAVAAASIDEAEAQRRVHIVAVRTAAAVAWLNGLYAARRITLFDDFRHENELLATIVQAQLAGGRGLPADLVAPGMEAADIADLFDAAQAQLAKAKAALVRLLGAAADEPLAGEAPAFAIDAAQLRAHVHTHPDLAIYGPTIEVAQARLHEAEAAKRPDWSVGVSYARRAALYSDMLSLQFSLSLPVFAGSRQDPLIDASRKDVHRLEAERASMLREHTDALEGELADYELLSRQLARLRDVRLPLARQKLQFQLTSYQGAKGDLGSVLGARRELIALRMQQIDLANQRDVAAAKLQYGYVEATP
jgi:outer membrane protein TolC